MNSAVNKAEEQMQQQSDRFALWAEKMAEVFGTDDDDNPFEIIEI